MPSARAVGRFVFAALVLVLAFGAVPARADKCTSAKLKAVGKKESGLLGCQSKVAAKNDTSGLAACESKVKGKFATAFGKAGACVGDQTTCENKADACETTVSMAMTDTFPSKCEAAKRKAAGKLARGELGCYAKAALKGLALDGSCVSKATGKFSTALTRAGSCPDGGSPQALVENSCVQPAATINGGGVVTDVCPPATCANGGIPCGGLCGTCGGGVCEGPTTCGGEASVTCDPAQVPVCIASGNEVGATCSTNAQCPAGDICFASGSGLCGTGTANGCVPLCPE